MDGVSAAQAAQSVDAVNRILQMAVKESTDMAEKLVKAAVEMSVGQEPGKGANIDVTA